jgi:multiple sugar transport system substrate-binding protein
MRVACAKYITAIMVCVLMAITATTGVLAAQTERITILWRDTAVELVALNEMISTFEAVHPGIEVEIVSCTNTEYEAKLSLMHAAGDPPDIFSSVGRAGLADFVHKGLVLPLDDWVARDKGLFQDFLPGSLDTLRVNGRLYGLPVGGVPTMMYYSPRLFDQAGVAYPPTSWDDKSWTWNSMVDTARKLTRDRDGDGRIDVFGVRMDLWPTVTNAWLWGGDWFEPEAYMTGIARRTIADSPAVAQSLQAQLDLMYTYHVMPQPGEGASFQSGTLAMGAEGGWFTRNWAIVPNLDWSIAPLPRGVDKIRNAVFTDPWAISSASKHKEAAWEFIKFAVSTEGQRIWSPNYTGVPIRRDQLRLLEAKFPNLSTTVLRDVFWGAWTCGQESPNHSIAGWADLELLITQGLSPVWNRQVSPENALAALTPRINALLKDIEAQISSIQEKR